MVYSIWSGIHYMVWCIVPYSSVIISLVLGADSNDPSVINKELDTDGLPPIGTILTPGCPLYRYGP